MSKPATLNKKATNQFCRLFKDLELTPGSHRKYDNAAGTFMACSIEVLRTGENYAIASVSHYGEQNGDLMADPDMTFLMLIYEGKILEVMPLTFKNDYMGFNQEAATVDDNGQLCYRAKMMKEQATFANTWINNIVLQQELKP